MERDVTDGFKGACPRQELRLIPWRTILKLKSLLKSQLNEYLNRRGQAITNLTSETRLREFISRFYPQSVGLDLIRLGGDGDGGYLVPDDLAGLTACFSPGVSDVANFELALAEDYGVVCHLADASVAGPPVHHKNIDFEGKFLGPSTEGETIRLTDWVNEKVGKNGNDLLLQMDIEGAEYGVLIDTPLELLSRFRIIVVELHAVHELFSAPKINLLEVILGKLTRLHTVVHLHPNNCCGTVTQSGVTIPRVLELTLLRNDRFTSANPANAFPHPLDRPNLSHKPDLVLPDDWYMAAG